METFENKPVNGQDDMPERTGDTPETESAPAIDPVPAFGTDAEASAGAADGMPAASSEDASVVPEPDFGSPLSPHGEAPKAEPDEVFSPEACWAREPDASDTSWHSTTVTDPVYRAPREEHRSPYADSPYISYDEAQRTGTTEQWRATFDDAPPAKKPRKERKKRTKGSKGIVAAALAFAVLGSALGAVITGSIMDRKMDNTTAKLQEQIDGLKKNNGGIVINTAGTPSGGGTVSESGAMNPAMVYEQNVRSVISVTTTGYTTNGWTTSQFTSSGSGFIITEDGYILTNYHVIEGYTAVEITTIDSETYEAEVVGYDEFSDVALLKVEAEGLPCVTIGDSDVATVGDMVAAIGNPLGELASTQTVGYISAKNRMVNTDGTILNMIQTDAAINSGNSGGPLFNMYGQVIGITTAKYSGSSSSGASIEGIGFAIPINTVMDLIEDLMEHGYVTNQAYMGVTLDEMDAAVAERYGLPTGPRVSSVEEGSAAEAAGIQVGDIIDAVGDTDISSYSDLSYALRTYRAGDTTTISVYRAGQELELTITFDEKPAQTVTTEPVETQPQNDGYGNDYGFGFFPWP